MIIGRELLVCIGIEWSVLGWKCDYLGKNRFQGAGWDNGRLVGFHSEERIGGTRAVQRDKR